jgi:hypothetical protein
MKEKLLLTLALWLALVVSTWAQSTPIAVTITKTDASVINSSGASLQETLEATTPGEVKKLDITAGSFTAADWQWLLDNKSALVSLTHFTITEGVSEVSNTRQTFNSIFNSNIELVNLYGITEIKNDDFRNCQFLSSVSFPSVTSIGNSAFYECTALSSVSFPVARSIGEVAFIRCSALDTVSFPDVTSIGTSAFYECGNLISVSFPNISSIGRYIFYDCLALRSVSFPVATSIGESAFEGCQSLSSFNFDGVISIGSYAFKKSALVSISLPEATSIGHYAFWLCESLVSVSCPKVTRIEAGTFQGCRYLSSVSIPMATSIASEAFFSCRSLSSVSFPRAASIGSRAFQFCFFLNDMLLGALPPSISGFDHFGNCPPTRYLAFADADGNLLTGVELENARAAYKAVDDGDVSDNLWNGWDISRNLSPITIDPSIANGVVTADNTEAKYFGGYVEGATITITATPEEGCILFPGSLRVYKTGDETVEVSLTGNSFTMPDFEVTVTALFEPLSLQVTFVAATSGNIPVGLVLESGAGRIAVDKGDGVLVPFDLDPDASFFYVMSYEAGSTVKVYSDNITILAFQTPLKTLDVSRATTLTQLICANTQLNFATLPQPKSSYTLYMYAPQQNLATTCTNGIVDLSSQLTALSVDGNTQNTVYTWHNANNTELVKDLDYTEKDGVFSFRKLPASSVYCTMTNAAFPFLSGSNALRTVDITIDAVASLQQVWTGTLSANWHVAANWNNNQVPMNIDMIEIPASAPHQPVLSSDAVCADLTIETGAVVTIASGATLSVTGQLVNNNGVDGLLLISDATGTGKLVNNTPSVPATVQQYIVQDQWHYFGLPIEGSHNVNNLLHNFYVVKSNEDRPMSNPWEYLTAQDNLTRGQGYGAFYSRNTNNDTTLVFKGLLNTGTITVETSNSGEGMGWNFVSNPYPCTLDWNVVKSNLTEIEDAVYVWNPTLTDNNKYGRYGTYVDGVQVNAQTQYIAPMQGFFVKAKAGNGEVSFTNAAKSTQASTFKSAELNALIRLNACDTNGYDDETVVRFKTGSTHEFDSRYDARKLNAISSLNPQIYSVLNGDEYSINSIPEVTVNTVIPFELLVKSTGTQQIAATELTGLDATLDVVLEDLQTGARTLLANSDYRFSATAGETRKFNLLFADATNVARVENRAIKAYGAESHLCISNMSDGRNIVAVYNLNGQLVHQANAEGSYTEVELPNGLYVVKVTPENGNVFNGKVRIGSFQ